MKILNLLDSLTRVEERHDFAEATSRRDAFSRLGSVAIDMAKVAAPFGILGLSSTSSYAQTGSSRTVAEVLNFALLLEYLEAEFYVTALDTAGLLTGNTRTTIEQISQHETAHVAFLQTALRNAGATVDPKPTFDFTADGAFPTVFSDINIFLAVAQAFEDTGVRAYKGQAPFLLGTGDVLTAALQIHSVEARHAAKIRTLRAQPGWITAATRIMGVPATDPDPVYAGEANVTHLGLNAVTNSGGVDFNRVTQSYDEPLTTAEVTAIATLFID